MALRFTGTILPPAKDLTLSRSFCRRRGPGYTGRRDMRHGDVEGKDDGGAMADERKLEGVDGVVLVIVAATSLAWSCWSGC
jgi:hypothetical protein